MPDARAGYTANPCYSSPMTPLGRELAEISAREMVAALGARNAPRLVQWGLALPFFAASRRLGETLASFASDADTQSLPAAAAQALSRFGVALRMTGAGAVEGPCLVLANHPGAYDALALMVAIGRSDLAIVAADREFLRALSGFSKHLLFVSEDPNERAGALKRSLAWLKKGGALLHFPAGKIEPDADYESDRTRLLESWQPGVGALVKACRRVSGRVLVAGVRGVHSPRAKRLLVNRWAERRGITTLSPLVQLLGGLRDVAARVRIEGVSATDDEPALRRALLNAIVTA
jgi:hypothetical protein